MKPSVYIETSIPSLYYEVRTGPDNVAPVSYTHLDVYKRQSYDPTFAYELAVIVQDGLRRMYQEQEHIFYYITTLNENYHHPAMPAGAEAGILKGMYLFKPGEGGGHRVQLFGCGAILNEVIAAADLLRDDWGVSADIWSLPGINPLARDGQDAMRWNLLHPEQPPRVPYVTACLDGHPGPVVAATDYMRMYAEQLRPFIHRHYSVPVSYTHLDVYKRQEV